MPEPDQKGRHVRSTRAIVQSAWQFLDRDFHRRHHIVADSACGIGVRNFQILGDDLSTEPSGELTS